MDTTAVNLCHLLALSGNAKHKRKRCHRGGGVTASLLLDPVDGFLHGTAAPNIYLTFRNVLFPFLFRAAYVSEKQSSFSSVRKFDLYI